MGVEGGEGERVEERRAPVSTCILLASSTVGH